MSGRPGLQAGRSPYTGWLVCVVIGSNTAEARAKGPRLDLQCYVLTLAASLSAAASPTATRSDG
jgi:hypothetical protein